MVEEAEVKKEEKPAKDAILDAAIVEFSKYGLSGARIDRIALRAKANKRMIYYYFGSKKGLYKTVLTTVYSGIVETMKDSLQDRPGEDRAGKISVIWEVYFKYLSAHPEYVAMIAWENLQRGVYGEGGQVEGVTHPIVDQVSRLLEQNNLFPKDYNVRHYLLCILGLAFYYFSNQYTMGMILGPDLFTPAEEKKYIETVKKMILLPLAGKK